MYYTNQWSRSGKPQPLCVDNGCEDEVALLARARGCEMPTDAFGIIFRHARKMSGAIEHRRPCRRLERHCDQAPYQPAFLGARRRAVDCSHFAEIVALRGRNCAALAIIPPLWRTLRVLCGMFNSTHAPSKELACPFATRSLRVRWCISCVHRHRSVARTRCAARATRTEGDRITRELVGVSTAFDSATASGSR